MYKDNQTNTWTAGSIGRKGFRASTVGGTALAVCWSSDWYGTSPGKSGGLRLFAGGVDGLVHEYTWTLAEDDWQSGFTFSDTNAFAGAACWPGGGITHLYLQNSRSHLEVWWKDFNTDQSNSSSHPLGNWNRGKNQGGRLMKATNRLSGPIAATEVRTNSSLAFSNFAYFQDSKGEILGIEPNGTAEMLNWGPSFIVGNQNGILGTSIACQTFFPSTTGPTGIHVYFQTNGTDVVEYVRGQEGGQWASDFLPVAET